jgi:hypothetical protein
MLAFAAKGAIQQFAVVAFSALVTAHILLLEPKSTCF